MSDSSRKGLPATNRLRRGTFLLRSASFGIASAGAFAEAARGETPAGFNDEPSMLHPGRPLSPYGMPSRYENNIVRRPTDLTPTNLASWDFTPLQDLRGIITPNGLFFERNHGGVPEIDPKQHRLLVHGLVERPLFFTVDDLMRMPSVSRIYFLECSGNGLTEWSKPTGKTVQYTHGLLSCCEWTGVPVSTLLNEVGLDQKAKWVLAEGADSAAMTRSIPIDKMLDDALIAYAQNGEMLRPEQGYPIRLLLPGFEGNMNIKWLRRLKVGASPFHTREETSKYTDLLPDGIAREFTFAMEAKSVITSPSGGQTLPGKGRYEVRGLAWSGRGRITRVDVSTDGGATWNEATLDAPVLPKALVAFRFPWSWDGSPRILQSRCVDETGYVQPTLKQLVAVRGVNSVYHLNAIQSWAIAPNGAITNVHA